MSNPEVVQLTGKISKIMVGHSQEAIRQALALFLAGTIVVGKQDEDEAVDHFLMALASSITALKSVSTPAAATPVADVCPTCHGLRRITIPVVPEQYVDANNNGIPVRCRVVTLEPCPACTATSPRAPGSA